MQISGIGHQSFFFISSLLSVSYERNYSGKMDGFLCINIDVRRLVKEYLFVLFRGTNFNPVFAQKMFMVYQFPHM